MYFEWLTDTILYIKNNDLLTSYQKLLRKLFETEYFCEYAEDIERAKDGLYLRNMYERDTGLECMAPTIGCSLLELMVALAMRCEDLIYDRRVENGIYNTFISMLDSLGIGSMDDYCYDDALVDEILKNFLEHEYLRNGYGSLFCIKDPSISLVDKSLWTQMNYWVLEKCGI